jgi:hypothetical protein
MAASWNGRRWTVENVPSPSGNNAGTSLEAVSCHSATDCMAVGSAGPAPSGPGGFQTLAEQWNGTAWAIVSTPRLAGAHAVANLVSVSCPRAARCTAVGFLTVRRKTRMLAERWNGARWTVGVPVTPAQAKNSGFSGVSCPARQACIAVGGYTTHTGKGGMLAEQHS